MESLKQEQGRATLLLVSMMYCGNQKSQYPTPGYGIVRLVITSVLLL